MTTSFEQLLELLSDEAQPFPTAKLAELSDLDAERVKQLCEVWNQFPVDRRRILLHEIGIQAELRFELTFEQVNRLALSDSDSDVRAIAIQNLWECESPDLVPHFLNTLNEDPISQVRAAAAKALGLFVWLGEIDQLSGDLLHQIEDDLIRATQEDQEEEVRRHSLESLGFSSRKEVPPLIDQAYHSGDEAYVRSALYAMGRSASDQWGTYVMVEMDNPSPIIRKEAARAAGELELREATEPLIELLDDVNTLVRDSAIWALGQLGGEQAADALLLLLDNAEDEELIQTLEEALDHLAFVNDTRDFLLIDFEDNEELNF
jgi:HEAT repeat protein